MIHTRNDGHSQELEYKVHYISVAYKAINTAFCCAKEYRHLCMQQYKCWKLT